MPEMTLNIDTGSMPRPYNKRGVCSVCGQEAYDPRATKCNEHRTTKPRSTTPPGRRSQSSADTITFVTPEGTETPAPKPPEPTTPQLTPKQQRAESIKGSILRELNPQMVKGFAFVCQPVPASNFYVLENGAMKVSDPLGKTAMFAEWEADIMGKCAAELESQPMVAIAGKSIAPVMPYLFMLGGIAVVGLHGLNMMKTRDGVLAQWQRMQADAQRAMPGAQPMPPPAETDETETVPQGEELAEPIDTDIVVLIPPSTNGQAPPPQPGEFADAALA